MRLKQPEEFSFLQGWQIIQKAGQPLPVTLQTFEDFSSFLRKLLLECCCHFLIHTGGVFAQMLIGIVVIGVVISLFV